MKNDQDLFRAHTNSAIYSPSATTSPPVLRPRSNSARQHRSRTDYLVLAEQANLVSPAPDAPVPMLTGIAPLGVQSQTEYLSYSGRKWLADPRACAPEDKCSPIFSEPNNLGGFYCFPFPIRRTRQRKILHLYLPCDCTATAKKSLLALQPRLSTPNDTQSNGCNVHSV